MKNKRMIQAGLLVVSVVLAAMGCWFCWNCPMEWLYGKGQHVLFMRHTMWNAIGIVLFAGAAMMRWKWWQKSAPWLLVGWVVLVLYALLFCHAIRGSHRWAEFGCLRINVQQLFVFSFALFAAWLGSKRRTRSWLAFVAVGVCLACCGYWVLSNAVRTARVVSFLTLGHVPDAFRPCDGWARHQFVAAFGAANCIGDAGVSLRLLPMPSNDGMASAAALIFGIWFPIVAFGLYATLGGLLSAIWLRCKESSGRMFVLFWGGSIMLSAVYGFFQCIGVVLPIGITPALVGYDGTRVIVFWLGLGALFSFMRNAERGNAGKGDAVNVIVWNALFLAFCYGVFVAFASTGRFHEPRPTQSAFGEYGVQAKRGAILAADGSVLARSHKVFMVHLDPQAAHLESWRSPQECYRTVAEMFGLSESFVSNQYAQTKNRYIKLADKTTREIVEECRSSPKLRDAGLVFTMDQRRDYPLGTNASHVVGCVRCPNMSQTMGLTGLERTYDLTLAGTNGFFISCIKLRDALVVGRPTNGGNVVTTIDPELQVGVAEALGATVATTGAEIGWGIVLEVPSGEIAAMASVPVYNPIRRDMKDSNPFRNNSTQMTFEPGGLLKPVTYAMAMDVGLITPKTKIDHGNGVWEYARTNYHDSCTGVLTVAESLIRRSNIAAGKVGVMLWTDRFKRDMPRFGFGRKVGCGTLYGEEVGIACRHNRYDPVSISRTGMGRCSAVTGIQVANAYAVFANDGVEVLPHLVSRTTDASGTDIFQFRPSVGVNRVVSSETAQRMTEMMEAAFKAAVAEAGADLGGVRVAGAVTETPMPEGGRYSLTNYNVAVVGFLPVEKPEYVVAVGFQKPKGDRSVGRVALPAFAEIVRKIQVQMTKTTEEE